MARPEVSCHPELLLDGARTVVAAALCYCARTCPSRRPTRAGCRATRGATSTRCCASGSTTLGRRLGGDVPRARRRQRPRRPRGRGSRRDRLLRQEHDGDHTPPRLVGRPRCRSSRTSRSSPSPPLELDCGECRLCIDACPTGALDEPGTLDSTKCLSYWTQAPAPIPEAYRAELGDMVYGCDICQDVCPWNRGVEKRRRGDAVPDRRDARGLAAPTGSSATGRTRRGVRSSLRSAGTTLAGCVATRSSPPGTSGVRRLRPSVERDVTVRRSDARATRRPGRSSGWTSAGSVTPSLDAERLAVLVHEVRSPVAALSAIAESARRRHRRGRRAVELVRLVTLACRGIERVVTDAAVASIRFEPIDPEQLVRDVVAGAVVRGADVELDGGRRATGDRRRSVPPSAGTRQSHRERVRARSRGRAPSSIRRRGCECCPDLGLRLRTRDRGGRARAHLRRRSPARSSRRADPASGWRSRARSSTDTADRSRSTSSPGEGATFTIALPLRQA